MITSEKKAHAKRDELNFANVVHNMFDDFCLRYGYHFTESLPTLVKYESKNAFINIYHGRISYEINAEIGLKIEAENKLSLSELIASTDKVEINVPIPFQTNSEEGVKKGVKAVAEVIKEHFLLLFSGDIDEYNYWYSLVKTYRAKDTKAYICNPIKSEAEDAWHNKDYKAVVSLYESIYDNLSKIEIKRLSYAKSRRE